MSSRVLYAIVDIRVTSGAAINIPTTKARTPVIIIKIEIKLKARRSSILPLVMFQDDLIASIKFGFSCSIKFNVTYCSLIAI